MAVLTTKIGFIMKILIYIISFLMLHSVAQANEELIEQLAETSSKVDGYFMNYGEEEYDWLYLSADEATLMKLREATSKDRFLNCEFQTIPTTHSI